MTIVYGPSNIILRKVINKYNGNFSGSTHTINELCYIRIHLPKHKPILLPFIFRHRNIEVNSECKGIIEVKFN